MNGNEFVSECSKNERFLVWNQNIGWSSKLHTKRGLKLFIHTSLLRDILVGYSSETIYFAVIDPYILIWCVIRGFDGPEVQNCDHKYLKKGK